MKFSNILNFFTSSTFIIILAVIALDLFFWFLSPFLGFGSAHPFDNALTRIIIVSVVSIGGVVLIFYLRHRKRKKDENLTNDIVASENTSSSSRAVLTDVTEMKQKLRDAMSLLRKSKLGQRHLFELPWYIMIGPPGAGKTTAIVNSGLKFPLAEQMGKSAIGGVGGTRNCDWWFTDNAVLVDTAGRYTTQESNVAADNAAWLGFLKLLRKHRKSQPINGAVIAISLSDLSMQDKATQKGNAIAVRKRLEELREELGVNFPVYILFTKADLIAGFSEFFETLGKHEREQVWGFTLSMSTSDREDSVLENFNVEFSKLLNRLDRLSLERIQEESDPNRRSLIAGFSAQVASIQVVAAEFLDEVFHENRYEEAQLFRGAYFTSGSQEGLPIDRLMQGMAQTFGIGRQNIGTGVGTGRSYFLTKLFDDVVFRESGLVALDDKAERKYLWLVRGALTASILL
ncbi:MAG: type VI secretion system membrane subunit TssM, partial [Rhodobacterales bacterium]